MISFLLILIIYCAIAIFFLLLVPIIFGKLNFISKEYYHNIIFINDFFSYKQYLFWILLFPFSLWIVSILLYPLNQALVTHVWIISFLFWLFLYAYIVFLLGRGPLLSIKNFLLIAFLSVLVTFIFNTIFYRQGYDALLPPNNIWFWTTTFLFVVSSFWSKNKSIFKEENQKRIEKYIATKRVDFENQYRDVFADLQNFEKNILLSIIIVEDYNRPKFIRCFERLLSRFNLAKTTGLAQVSEKSLSDKKSVELLKIKIKEYFKNINTGVPTIEQLEKFLRDYNGNNYNELVIAILKNIDNDFLDEN